jgi:mannose-6-phosphate isomerase-like protein (cupin superfamily)
MLAGKIWGTTKLLESNSSLEFHRITVVAGARCSQHLHQHKWNGFFVESGSLLIRVWQNNYDLVDETVLTAGEYTRVAPGLYHQFEALADTVAFEIYWTDSLDCADIVRRTVGSAD